MYKAPEQFEIPNEVKEYQSDCEALGMIQDLEKWYVTPEWSQKFKKHWEALLNLAEAGEPWAQYNLGSMYFGGYLYSSRDDYEENYESDVMTGSYWLEKCAKQGFVAAVDTLVVVGVGDEAERLREIYRKVEKEHPEYIQKWEENENIPVILPLLFEEVWKIAYGKDS